MINKTQEVAHNNIKKKGKSKLKEFICSRSRSSSSSINSVN